MARQQEVVHPFPGDFLFGVATADHQCEGSNPRWPEDIRDVWERDHHLTLRQSATDFWTRYAEDIQHAKDLGCKLFRFSIAWSRVQRPAGDFDEEAFNHYRDVINTIRAAGMEPVVTLHHFTWPVHVEERAAPDNPNDRGLIATDFPDLFKSYVTEVAKRFGPEVPYWITFNEPSQLVYGFIKPAWDSEYHTPPGRDADPREQVARVAKLMRNLFIANTVAREAILAANPAAKVGTNPLIMGIPHWLQDLVNANASRRRGGSAPSGTPGALPKDPLKEWGKLDVIVIAIVGILFSVLTDLLFHGLRHRPTPESSPITQSGAQTRTASNPPNFWAILGDLIRHPRQYSIILTVCLSNWWQLGMAGKLPEYVCPVGCVGRQDFVGFDYYWGIRRWRLDRLIRLYDAMLGRFDRAPVWAGVLYDMVKHHVEMFPDQPILIVENGCVTEADGRSRVRYLKEHLAEVQRAVSQGLPVLGYICWSITSNREWGLPFGPESDFGLYHIALDETGGKLVRQPTDAVQAYGEIIRTRTVSHVHL